MKKGLTIIELTIAIALLAIIMAACVSIFVTAIKNYQTNFQKSTMQKEVNFTIDAIANDVKNAASIRNIEGDYETSDEVIVIDLPATNANGEFLYTGQDLELDHVVYYISNGTVRKHIYSNPNGQRYAQNNSDYEILEDVSDLFFEYSPGMGNASQVKTTIDTSKVVGKNTITLTQSRTANLRNKQQ